MTSRIYVHPSFKKKLKRIAIDKDMTVMGLTEKLGTEKEDLFNICGWRKNGKKKTKYVFEI